ncbi:periplasmic binding protein-like I [Pilobolus umbonatus]|nr:periplasmic binding protein-like I [Pilobolus umbonatus]
MVYIIQSAVVFENVTIPNGKPVYTVGIMFPDINDVKLTDPGLVNVIVTNELAIKLAAESIERDNILPDVQLKFLRYYSLKGNNGVTSWNTVNMINDNVNAVIGDIVGDMTESSAALTSYMKIPQCSSVSTSFQLSNKDIYPYFFRTTGNIILFSQALVDWVKYMGWPTFALLYSNDNVGQQVLSTVIDRAKKNEIEAIEKIPLYDTSEEMIKDALYQLEKRGCRLIVLTEANTSKQLLILQHAMQMGLLSKGWVWIVANDITPLLYKIAPTPDELVLYNGLMFMSGLWDLTGQPAFDAFHREWNKQEIPEEFVNPSKWKLAGLSYKATSAYSCAELFALGLNKALDNYPGGRKSGLAALSAGRFDSTTMTPTHYNMQYEGPSGDLISSYFQVAYISNGEAISYATIKLDEFIMDPDMEIVYLGNIKYQPPSMVIQNVRNPSISNPQGVLVMTICAISLSLCAMMGILIYFFRDLKPIMVASPIFCYFQLVGLSLTYVYILLFLEKPSVLKCITRQISLTIGFSLVIGSIIAKNYRIYRVFQNVFTLHASRLKSSFLLQIVGFFGFITILPLIVWYAIYPMEVITIPIDVSSYCWVCAYPTAKAGYKNYITASELSVGILGGILIIIAALLGWKTKHINKKWSETTQIAYVTFNIAVAAAIGSPSIFLPTEYYNVSVYLKLVSIAFGASFTLIVMFLPKLIFIIKHIIQNEKMFNLYRMSSDSQVHLTHNDANDIDMDIVDQYNSDASIQAYEGILPVKKMARLEILSIWQLKHLIIVPQKKYFILSSTIGSNSTSYIYHHFEPVVSKNKDQFMFLLRTETGFSFLFQVADEPSLKKWLAWLKYRRAPSPTTTAPTEVIPDHKQHLLSLLPKKKQQQATFGVCAPGTSTMDEPSVNTPTRNHFHPSYTPSEKDSDGLPSPIVPSPSYIASSLSYIGPSQIHLNESGSNPYNSFGADSNKNWQRYP